VYIAQKEGNNWYFGDSAAFTFNTNPVTVLSNSAMHTWNGASSISDRYGNLLMYSNGETVFNKNHQIMDNGTGLFANSRNQTAMFVPRPGDSSIYYLFTPSGTLHQQPSPPPPKGFFYHIIDLSYNNGLGRVISKNNFLLTNETSKVNAIHHSNRSSIWVTAFGFDTNAFYSFLIDSNGLDTSPVVSYCGTVFNSHPIYDQLGTLKFSSNGKKIIVVKGSIIGIIELFQFNSSTGVVSFEKLIANTAKTWQAEFSPDCSKIYYTAKPTGQDYSIFQTDLLNNYNIKTVYTSNQLNFVDIQIGPDQKLYCAESLKPFVHIIENPNEKGIKCNLSLNAINLGNGILYR
jgi:hypothetical protein